MKKLIIILIFFLLVSCGKTKETADISLINEIDFSCVQELDLDLHSKEYLLVDLSEFNVLYGKDYDKKIYPASLTKLMTLDVVLNLVDDLNKTSSVSEDQLLELKYLDASVAKLEADKQYSINDLLYALILPSGADAAKAIENYFNDNDMNIINEISSQLKVLGCNDTNFVNTTGLHDDNHYTTLNDLLKILLDVLSFDEGRKILETIEYDIDDLKLQSTLTSVALEDSDVLGGKTGFTDESGQSIMILYRKNNRSYVLFLANATDERPNREYWHFIDAMDILEELY